MATNSKASSQMQIGNKIRWEQALHFPNNFLHLSKNIITSFVL